MLPRYYQGSWCHNLADTLEEEKKQNTKTMAIWVTEA